MPVTPSGTSTPHYLYPAVAVENTAGAHVAGVVVTYKAADGTTLTPRDALTQVVLSSVVTDSDGFAPPVYLPSDGGPVLAAAGGRVSQLSSAEGLSPAQIAALQTQVAQAVAAAQAAQAAAQAASAGVGLPGAQGPQGAQGPAGPAGPAGAQGPAGPSSVFAILDVQYGASPVRTGDIIRVQFDRTQSVTGFGVFVDQPAGGTAAQFVLDKLPAGSGTRLQAQSTVNLPVDTARSGRSVTAVSFDAGDEGIVRCVSAGSRPPTNALVRLVGTGLSLPPVKGALTALTIGTATASGSNVALTATGGSGPWDTLLIERDGDIVDALSFEEWTAAGGTYLDLGAANDPSVYRLGVSHRDSCAWSSTVTYTPAAAPGALGFSSASTPASVAGTVSATTPQTITFTFNRAVAVGETVYLALARSGNTTANTVTALAGTGITWDALPSAANSRIVMDAGSTQTAVLAVGTVTTARASGATGSITLSGTALNTAVQVFTSTGTRGVVDQANSSSGTGTGMSVPATSALSGQPALAVALFVSLVKTVSGTASTFAGATFTFASTSGSNDRQGLVMFKPDVTSTAGVAASATLSASSAWAGIVAVVRAV